MTTSRHDMRHGRQGGRIVDYHTRGELADLEAERARKAIRVPIFPTEDEARSKARAVGGTVHPVPNSSQWVVFPPDRSPADLPAWFPPPSARSTDPDTSHDAAAKATARAASDRALVLRIHQQHSSGLTDFELADIAGRQQTSLGVRRGDLRKIGLIANSGLKRPAPSGTPATVWIITDLGLARDANLPIERGAA